mmetsp:Transcript_59881/g.165699  ORF Transcript_59881/g.165699 Transcript_59881/m.165699 type:complete len:234 (-) Transcript_59881:42-743(-)
MVIGQQSRRVSELRHTISWLHASSAARCLASSARTRASAADSSHVLTCWLSSGIPRGWVITTAKTKSEMRGSWMCTLMELMPCFRPAEMACGTSRLLWPSSGGATAKISLPFATNRRDCGHAWQGLQLSSLSMRTSTARPSRRHCRSSGKSRAKSRVGCANSASFSTPLGSTTALKGSMALKRQLGHTKAAGSCRQGRSNAPVQPLQRSGRRREAAGEPAAWSPAPTPSGPRS